jgi:hypothetical protein
MEAPSSVRRSGGTTTTGPPGPGGWPKRAGGRWPSINEFKLRYSIGTAGGRPNYSDRFETYSLHHRVEALSKATLGNRFLRPERAVEQEFGLDVIFRDRYSMQLSHSRNKTDRPADRDSAPRGPSASTTQWQNAGTVEGTTWELTLEAAVVDTPNLGLNLGFVADKSDHEITEFDRACFRAGP